MTTRHIVGIDIGGTNTGTVLIQVTPNRLPQVLKMHPLNYEQVQKKTIHNSLSSAWIIAAVKYKNPLNTIKAIADTVKGKISIK